MENRLLITGASGLLGATALMNIKTPLEIHGTYLSHPISLPNTNCVKLDLTDVGKVREYLRELRPKIILHTAAAVHVDDCETNKDLAYKTNVVATELLAQYAADSGAQLIYISTDAFFDGGDKLFTEEDEPTPMNYYGETKLIAEKFVLKSCPNALVLRTNLYGWNYQDKLSLAEWMLSNLTQKKTIPLVHDVHYTPILTNTFVNCVESLIDIKARGIFHVGGVPRISKLQFGQWLCETFDLSQEYIRPSSVKDLKLQARRSSNMALNTEKLRRLLPQLSLDVREDLQRFKRLLDEDYPSKLKARR